MPEYTAIIAADGDQNVSVAGTSATLTLPAQFSSTGGAHSGRAILECHTAAILYTLNGTAPTDADWATGQRLGIGDQLILTSRQEMRNVKMIRATATSGAVFVRYEMRTN